MRKCNVCGRRFRLLAKNRYEVVKSPVGLNCLTEGTVYFNAFDCPHCGCQNTVGAFVKEKVRDNEPVQVELEGDGYADGELVYDFGKCPKCGWGFEEGDKDWKEPYCCHCGQKLHWFETQRGEDES